MRPPMLPNVKFIGVYPLPFWGLQTSATLQSTPGPEITASYSATNAEIAPSLGRDLSAGRELDGSAGPDSERHALRRAHQPGRLPLSKVFRLGNARIQGMFDLYNALNASPFLSMQNRYGPAWQMPTQALIGRLAKFGMQLDF